MLLGGRYDRPAWPLAPSGRVVMRRGGLECEVAAHQPPRNEIILLSRLPYPCWGSSRRLCAPGWVLHLPKRLATARKRLLGDAGDGKTCSPRGKYRRVSAHHAATHMAHHALAPSRPLVRTLALSAFSRADREREVRGRQRGRGRRGSDGSRPRPCIPPRDPGGTCRGMWGGGRRGSAGRRRTSLARVNRDGRVGERGVEGRVKSFLGLVILPKNADSIGFITFRMC